MPPKPTIRECDRIITSPGMVLEMEEKVMDGRRVRVWKNLPPSFRSFILPSFEAYSDRVFLSSAVWRTGQESRAAPREHVTFGEVLRRAAELAAWMRIQGLGVGSRIAIGGRNCTGWIVSFVACQLIGAVSVCLNAWLHKDQLLHCLSITSPHLVLVDAERAIVLGPSVPGLQAVGVGQVISWDPLPASFESLSSIRSVGEVLESSELDTRSILQGPDLRDLSPESDAVIFFSSGTSGLPKAVLSTQRMALSNLFSGMVAPARAALRAGLTIPPLPKPSDPQRTVLLAIPLFHVTGCLSWLMRAIFAGSKIVLLPRWNIDQAVKLIETENVTVIGGVPSVVSAILQAPGLPKSKAFDTVFYGGAPPSRELAREVKARWPKAGLVQGYGLTETNAYVCSVAGGDYVERPESTGPPVPICDVKIVSPASREELPTGETGLLMVRGPQVMKCYYNNPEETSFAIDSDGWLDTGDVGYTDKEGFLYIKDRLKDIIVRGGENIMSADIENALYADPRIGEAVAIGIPDNILGERVGAIVSLRTIENHIPKATETDLIYTVSSKLGRRAVPEIILIWHGPLPRNANGKVVKKDLKSYVVEAWETRQKGSHLGVHVKSKL
ncbi:putative long-chain-fatty-acid--CoA ligase [Naematelia encephala]|uniref:Putative long-chain-fatty-acid--CoA ligase n=1 Tax=Naematelia encephala TaxID=71784 RepID=A0A1Y2BLF6_9TREE|nr:putative long-chain-fatty-acid--CoA ligase [Naematelia encephala]